MRCLYCGKKLSLLKLAKGDSFCSPEHFDAFQLKESKSAFDRLMSLGEPEGPKAPLVLKPVEPESKPVEVNPIAAARPELPPNRTEPQPANLESRPDQVEVAQVVENRRPVDIPAAAKKVEPQAPPSAPFTAQGRPMFFDTPHNIAGSEEFNNPILPEAPRVTWPIHEVHEAEDILNLHLQLQFAGIEPSAADSKREFVAEDEPFTTAVEHPSMDASPELPEIECAEPAEPEAPAARCEAPAARFEEPAARFEAPAPEVERSEGIEATATSIEAPLAEPNAPDPPQIQDAAGAQPQAPAAETEAHPEIEAVTAEIQAPLVEANAPESKPELPPIEFVAADEPEASPAAEIDTRVVELKAPAVKLEAPQASSIPYLFSPSFLARSGTARFFDPAHAPAVNDFTVPSTLGEREIRGIEARQMPRYTRPVKTAPFAARNFTAASAATVAEIQASPVRTLPQGQKNTCGPAWTASNRLIAIPARTLNAVLPRPRAADFDLPRPASFLVRPDPAAIRAIDPQKMVRELDTKSALRGDLETVLADAKWTIFQAGGPFDGAVSTMLAQCLDQPACPRFPWESSTGVMTLETRIAPHEVTRTSALPAFAYSAAPVHPSPSWVLSAVSAPWNFISRYVPRESRQIDAFLEGRPVPYGPIVHISTKRPGHAPIPPRGLPDEPAGFVADWKAYPPKSIEKRIARFLPVRDVQQLPAARPWPRLGALPR